MLRAGEAPFGNILDSWNGCDSGASMPAISVSYSQGLALKALLAASKGKAVNATVAVGAAGGG